MALPTPDLAQQLVGEEEGLTLVAKPDTHGLWEIGYGHDLPAGDHTGLTWSEARADSNLATDLAAARSIAAYLPHYADANAVRQAVLVSMCFQMGTKPHSWPNFMQALSAEDYDAAAAAGLDSDWARTETPTRAKREMAMLKSGVWSPKEST